MLNTLVSTSVESVSDPDAPTISKALLDIVRGSEHSSETRVFFGTIQLLELGFAAKTIVAVVQDLVDNYYLSEGCVGSACEAVRLYGAC